MTTRFKLAASTLALIVFVRCRPAPPPGRPHGILMGGRVGELAGTA